MELGRTTQACSYCVCGHGLGLAHTIGSQQQYSTAASCHHGLGSEYTAAASAATAPHAPPAHQWPFGPSPWDHLAHWGRLPVALDAAAADSTAVTRVLASPAALQALGSMCQQQEEGEGGASALRAAVLVHLEQLLQMHPEALLAALEAIDLSTTSAYPRACTVFPQQILNVLAGPCAAVRALIELRAVGASPEVLPPCGPAAPQRPGTAQP
jgi:hypothetical protein